MIRSKRFFYLLIFLAIVAALFYSTLAGVVILIGAIIYYYVLGRQYRIPSVKPTGEPKQIEIQEPKQISCKRCSTMFDPSANTSCPSCGAPVEG